MMKRRIYLAGGCFWGLEAFLKQLPGVLNTQVGYANGRTEAPSYEAVCHQDTGHAETVEVGYDAEELPLTLLLQAFLAVIDPTSRNRQGNDYGTQYRSGIYYTEAQERPQLEAVLHANDDVSITSPPITGIFGVINYSYASKVKVGYANAKAVV